MNSKRNTRLKGIKTMIELGGREKHKDSDK